MGSFVQARYVHWYTGALYIKNSLVVVQLFVKVQYSYLIQFWSVVRFLSGRISFPDLLSREFNRFLRGITTAAPHYGCVVNVGFNVGIEEKL